MTDDGRPEVSVIIPVYLGARLIERTLQSLAAQTFENYEVLCIDDCSPDDSRQVIEAAAAGDARIRYLRTPQNLGIVPKVMNFARDKFRGRYFIYSSQDDTFSTDWLDSLVAMAERSGADAVVPNLSMVDEEGVAFRRLVNDWRHPISGTDAFLLSLDWTVPTNALWPGRLLQDIGYADFGMFADEYSGRLFFLECRQVAFASGEFHYSHGNPAAITKKVSPGLLDATYNEYRLWRLVKERCPGSEWVSKYAWLAYTSLRESCFKLARHPELAGHEKRLEPALSGMSQADFLEALDSRLGNPVSRMGARLVIRHAWARRALGMAMHLGRRVKG